MVSFKDKLRAFKEANKETLRDVEVSPASTAQKPVIKEQESEQLPEVEEQLSDEELFLQALQNTSKGEAIMRKYERTELEKPARREREGDDSLAPEEKKDIRDQSLFLQWVGDFESPPEK